MPDVMQHPPDTTTMSARAPAPSRRQAKPPKNHTGLIVLTLFFSLIAAVSSGTIAYLHWLSLFPQTQEPIVEIVEEDPVMEEIPFIEFGSHHLPIDESLAVNAYDQDAFVVGDDGIISYPGARLGIDVSQHEGEIDWQAVAEDGVTFALIRLGFRGYGQEGNMVLDARFHENIQGAQSAGIDVGVYFFSQATSVWDTLEEAYFVLEHLDGYELQLPVVFDWEFIDYNASARTTGTQGQSITLYNRVFNAEMQKAGYDTMVYFNQTLAYLYLDLDTLSDNPFWLASYRNNPTFYYHFDIWQYSDKGSINGIDGSVDLNLMFHDLTQSHLDTDV